ncbi:MAG: FAD-dependent oxidoreductase, partial [Nitrospinota bacterium]
MYDIAIIGGGVAGLVTASGAAQFGAKVALVEKGKMGGDCLNYGCVPTKALVHTARIFHKVKNSAEHGIDISSLKFDFRKAMDHMRGIQAEIAKHDDPERFRKMGVDVFLGDGKFADQNTFKVGGQTIKSKKFLIATGSRPVKLPIPGLDKVDSLNNETILELNKLPSSMLILGAGPIGMEYAQIFARFGTKVTVIEKMGQILPREEKELADILEGVFKREGVDVQTCIETKNMEQTNGKIRLTADCQKDQCEKTFEADKLFAASGRAPNVEGLNLEGIGVAFDRRGIKVDDTLKTTVANIWAAGDVTGMFPFTHMAEYEAGIVISNALFPLVNRKVRKDVV